MHVPHPEKVCCERFDAVELRGHVSCAKIFMLLSTGHYACLCIASHSIHWHGLSPLSCALIRNQALGLLELLLKYGMDICDSKLSGHHFLKQDHLMTALCLPPVDLDFETFLNEDNEAAMEAASGYQPQSAEEP